MTLYEIAEDYQSLFASLACADEVTDDQLDFLNQIGSDMQNKAINVAGLIKNLEVEQTAVEKACESMKDRASKLDAKISRLKEYLKGNLEKCQINKITQSPFFTISIKKCPLSVDILNEGLISDEYKNKKEVITLDKEKIRFELEQGVFIEGAKLKQNTRLEIK